MIDEQFWEWLLSPIIFFFDKFFRVLFFSWFFFSFSRQTKTCFFSHPLPQPRVNQSWMIVEVWPKCRHLKSCCFQARHLVSEVSFTSSYLVSCEVWRLTVLIGWVTIVSYYYSLLLRPTLVGFGRTSVFTIDGIQYSNIVTNATLVEKRHLFTRGITYMFRIRVGIGRDS
jgi:hypothetical protein